MWGNTDSVSIRTMSAKRRPPKPLHYDAKRRRLWIRGQRCHHGATGALMAGAGIVGLAALRVPAIGAVVAAGGVLMVHDWHDRRVWFARGWQ
jgi:hypothetical protein